MLTIDDLSLDQRQVFDVMIDWGSDPHSTTRVLTIGGYAGTGKSSLLGVFANSLVDSGKLVAYVSFTGRASSVLRTKLEACDVKVTNLLQADSNREEFAGYSYSVGSPESELPFCGTIHRFLYKPIIDKKTEEILGWNKRDKLDRKYDLIVIDEASMVSDEMLADLDIHDTQIMAVGDHAQLPPVMASGTLMKNPHLRLEKIHRQAEGNPIIQLSKQVREKGLLKPVDGGQVRFRPKKQLPEVLVEAYGDTNALDLGVLCWTNRSRVMLNGVVRKVLEFKGPPREDEIVICLKNKPPVYNGMRGVVCEDMIGGRSPWILNAQLTFPEENLPEQLYTLNAAQFMREKTFSSVEELKERGIDVDYMSAAGLPFDFGYALTTHKSQGSQFRHAIVYLDRPSRPHDEEYRRWSYTAVTRSSDILTVLQ